MKKSIISTNLIDEKGDTAAPQQGLFHNKIKNTGEIRIYMQPAQLIVTRIKEEVLVKRQLEKVRADTLNRTPVAYV